VVEPFVDLSLWADLRRDPLRLATTPHRSRLRSWATEMLAKGVPPFQVGLALLLVALVGDMTDDLQIKARARANRKREASDLGRWFG
jgi:hypothetical protein